MSIDNHIGRKGALSITVLVLLALVSAGVVVTGTTGVTPTQATTNPVVFTPTQTTVFSTTTSQSPDTLTTSAPNRTTVTPTDTATPIPTVTSTPEQTAITPWFDIEEQRSNVANENASIRITAFNASPSSYEATVTLTYQLTNTADHEASATFFFELRWGSKMVTSSSQTITLSQNESITISKTHTFERSGGYSVSGYTNDGVSYFTYIEIDHI